jgi:hypothetical protein
MSDQWIRRLVLGWACGGVALALLQRPLTDEFWILAPLAGMAYLVVGVVVAGYAIWRSLGPARAPRATMFIACGAVLGLPVTALPLARAGDALTFRARFFLHRDHYTRIVDSELALIGSKPGLSGQTRRAQGYYVDAGPPVRLAFIQPGGIIDNWEGIIYDPTGLLEAAKGWSYASGQQEFTAPPAVRRLFGGDLVACRHIEGPWYRCWFT